MGNLLVSPITDKETHRGQTPDGELTYAVSSMQGWRVHMEDAHISEPTMYAEERIPVVDADAHDGAELFPTSSPTLTSTSLSALHSTTAAGMSSSSSSSSSSPTASNIATDTDTNNTASHSLGTTACTLSSPSKREECGMDGTNAPGGLIKKAKTNDDSNDGTTSNTAPSTAPTNDNTNNSSSGSGSGTSSNNNNNNKKSKNKYRKLDLPNHSLFAVFDGHGGSFAAQYSGLNFTRVLSRQASFVQYAHFVHAQNTRDMMERDSPTTSSRSNSNTNTNTNSNNNNNNHNNSNDDTTMSMSMNSPVQQAQNHRKELELLEQAFRDAFLDLDREIWRVVNHLKNEDCRLPSRNNNADGGGSNGSNGNDSGNGNGDSYNEDDEVEDDYSYSQQDSGTTIVVVMFTPQYIICANAGDSRSVYSKQRNCTIPLSYDHKPDDEDEERRITDAGGFVRVGRVDGDLAVSRGLGDFRFKDYELYKSMGTTAVCDLPHLNNKNGEKRSKKRGGGITMSNRDNGGGGGGDYDGDNEGSGGILPDDQKVSPIPDIIVQKRDRELDEFVVIACDGIFDVQTNHQCISLTAEIFRDGETDMGLLCEEILDVCLIQGSKDNMTALVVKLPAQPIGEGGGVMQRREVRRLQKLEEDQDGAKSQYA